MRVTLAVVMSVVLFAPGTARAVAALSGKWTLSGDVQGNAVNLDCAFTEADTRLAGRCQVNGMEAVDVYTLNYSGKVDGDAMAGAIEVAGASGTFSGTRAKS